MKLHFRDTGVLKTTEPEGIAQAYLTKWDSIDAYNTTFKRGAFTDSFNKRPANKIRVLWNHHELAGKTLEAKEDDYGPLVKVQFNMNTQAGKTAYEHLQAGDIDCFSFGFRKISDETLENGIQMITGIEVVEVSPVVFEANSQAKVVDVRSEIRPDLIERTLQQLIDLNLTEEEKKDLGVRIGLILSDSEKKTIDDFYNMLKQFQK